MQTECAEYQSLCSESTPLSIDGEEGGPKEFPFMVFLLFCHRENLKQKSNFIH